MVTKKRRKWTGTFSSATWNSRNPHFDVCYCWLQFGLDVGGHSKWHLYTQTGLSYRWHDTPYRTLLDGSWVLLLACLFFSGAWLLHSSAVSNIFWTQPAERKTDTHLASERFLYLLSRYSRKDFIFLEIMAFISDRYCHKTWLEVGKCFSSFWREKKLSDVIFPWLRTSFWVP